MHGQKNIKLLVVLLGSGYSEMKFWARNYHTEWLNSSEFILLYALSLDVEYALALIINIS